MFAFPVPGPLQCKQNKLTNRAYVRSSSITYYSNNSHVFTIGAGFLGVVEIQDTGPPIA